MLTLDLKDYAREYIRLSLLGVDNINSLTECTKVLPPTTTSFINKDQSLLDKWLAVLDFTSIARRISEALDNGEEVPAYA
jgi:hypothetical protein